MVRRALFVGAAVVALGSQSEAQAAGSCSIVKIAELPVMMAGNQPMVTAKINGVEERFLADSGAFYSVITPGTAAELKLHLEPAPIGFYMSGAGGTASASLTKVKTFTLAGVDIPNITFLVGGSETGGAGVLGQNVWSLGDVEYDLANGVIRLMRPKDCKGMTLSYWAAGMPVSTLPIAMPDSHDPHTIGTVLINGRPVKAAFDTGAGGSILSLSAAARLGIKPGDPGVREAGYGSGIGKRMLESWTAPFASFKIGDEEIRNPRIRIGDLGPSSTVDMLIGADFFLSHRVYVANSQRLLYITYNGGPVFNLGRFPSSKTEDLPDAALPTDADGFARRAAASAARRDFKNALDDIGRAVDMTPTEPRYLVERARIHMAMRQSFLALADIDQALRLKPDDPQALMTRANMRFAAKDRTGSLADLDAASAALSAESDLRLMLASDYSRGEAWDKALANYDQWIARHPQDSKQLLALNGRAWVRAMAGRDLDKALRDANSAVRAQPKIASFLDTRGMVNLRLGQLDAAIADFDAALAIEPKIAWSLYGRGIAKAKKGDVEGSKADIAAATAIRGDIGDEAKRAGLMP